MKSLAILSPVLLLLLSCSQETASTAAAISEGDWGVDQRRQWAADLRNEGLDDQAIAAYEDLINDRSLSKNAIIGSSVVVAEIHMKKGRYGEALASLLRASQLAPEGDVARKIGTWKIECLERLGRSAAADRMLDQEVRNLSGKTPPSAEVVVAKVGSESITRTDLETLIAQQSPELKQRLETSAGRLELVKNLVAQRVLERKARKLGLHDDEKVRLAVDLATRDILVRKLVADEVRGKLELKPEDAKLYYEAHRERFREPSQVQIAHIVVDDLEQEKIVRAAIDRDGWEAACRTHSHDGATREAGGLIEKPFVEGQGHEAIVDVRGLFEALGATPADEIAERSLKSTRGRHILKVLKRQDGRPIPFDEVKETALRMLQAEREQAAVAEMMKQALKSADVQLFEDAIGK